MQDKKHIVILLHESVTSKKMETYSISRYIEYWEREGHIITVLCGTKKFIPADILFMHVDLTVIPKEYFEFAKQYPIVINGDVHDIRKSVCSQLVLDHDTDYTGPVIVKTELNSFGRQEQKLSKNWISRLLMKKTMLKEYKIYNNYKEVPKKIVDNPHLVIEKFLPEKNGEKYSMRTYVFLGDKEKWTKVTSKDPIIKGANAIEIEQIPPEPKIIELRKKMKFDYGKFDYIMHNGEPILFDANKTIGRAINRNGVKANQPLLEYMASGILDFK